MTCSLGEGCGERGQYRVEVEPGVVAVACLRHMEEARDAGVPDERFVALGYRRGKRSMA